MSHPDWALSWGKGVHERVAIPDEVLAIVEERQRGRHCEDCKRLGLVTPPDEPIHVDHRQPLVLGGDSHHSNLAFRCRSHNLAKAGRATTKARQPAWRRRGRR